MSSSSKWKQVAQKVTTTKSTFDKKAKDKDYFKSSTSINQSVQFEHLLQNNGDSLLQKSAMRLFWKLSQGQIGSDKKKDFLLRRELITLENENGREFLKDLLVYICELDHEKIVKQGVPVFDLCGKFVRYLSSNSSTFGGSSSDSVSSLEKPILEPKLPTFPLESAERLSSNRVSLSTGLSPHLKRRKFNEDTVKSVKKKPFTFDVAKAVSNSLRKSSRGVRRFVKSQLRFSEVLQTEDHITFDITNYTIKAVKNAAYVMIQEQPKCHLETLVNLSTRLCWMSVKTSQIRNQSFQIGCELSMALEEQGIKFLQALMSTMSKISAGSLNKENINLDLAIGHVAISVVNALREVEREARGSPLIRGSSVKRGIDQKVDSRVNLETPVNEKVVVRLPTSRRTVKPQRKSVTTPSKSDDSVVVKLFQ